MSASFRVTRRVEFCETDAAGIVHFSSYFQYMEQAEHALLRHVGLSVFMDDEQGTISWPRVAAQCDYSGGLRFEDEVDIQVSIERIGERSITYLFEFTRDEKQLALGKMTCVCCRVDHSHPPQSMPIPNWFTEPLKSYLR